MLALQLQAFAELSSQAPSQVGGWGGESALQEAVEDTLTLNPKNKANTLNPKL